MFVFVCKGYRKGYPTYIRRSRRTVLGHNHVIRGAEAPLPRRLYHGHLDVNSQSPVFDRISLRHSNNYSNNYSTRTETTYSSANPKELGRVGFADTQISILPVVTGSAMCVQRFDDSRICRSHYVSHFAAFFIVVGAKTSVAESRMAFASYARGSSFARNSNRALFS